jgi:hypothetical protein
VKNIDWEGDVVINCAHIGKFGENNEEYLKKNILLLTNLKRRWPKTKLISFGSGAMYDKSKPIIKAKEYSSSVYPEDIYGLVKRVTVDISDVTLIIFGLYAKTRFVKSVIDHIEKNEPVVIFQDVKYSWVNLSDIPNVLDWAIKYGQGRYNLCGYDMLLSEIAKYLWATDIVYQKEGIANEYTGFPNKNIKLNSCPNF